MEKIYFYDTCALLENFQKAFDRGRVTISSITLKELEEIKTASYKDEEIKYKARKLLHYIQEHMNEIDIVIYKNNLDEYLNSLSLPLNNDSRIIVSALILLEEEKEDNKLIFFSNDISCATIAASVGLEVQTNYIDYSEEYTGFKEITLNEQELAKFYSDIVYQKENPYNLLNEQYLLIKHRNNEVKNKNNEIIDIYKWSEKMGYTKIRYNKFDSKTFGKVTAKDDYQRIAMDALKNHQITMLRGKAGTGKSYLSFAYMFELLEKNEIDKIIIFCNTVATKGSAKLGFYPGSRDEKLLDSQIGNLLSSKLGDKIAVERMIQDGSLILLPMSDIRGYDTTGMRAAVYISEAQNLDIELMRLALQRIGEDSICILDGDSNAQVDLSLYAGNNNGMRRVSEVFRGSDIYAEVTLQQIHRSKIAELADSM